MRSFTWLLVLVVLGGVAWLVWSTAPSRPSVHNPQLSHTVAPGPTAPAAVLQPPVAPVTPDVAPPPQVGDGAAIEPASGLTRVAATSGPAGTPAAVEAINAAAFAPAAAKPPKTTAYDPLLLRTEVLLDRAGFSPGVIDGKDGDNLHHALAAYAASQGLSADGALNKSLWDRLTQQDAAPAMQAYVITAADAAGPFIGQPPKDYRELAKLPALSYATPLQMLAEKFHMDQALLKTLNPGAAFGKAGVTIIAAAPRPSSRTLQAARIEVDKGANILRVYGADGRLSASYPASVGSAERPAPSGVFAVKAVAPRPAYYYDPSRLTFAPEGAKGKLKIAPGPNNPVGSTWIALTVETYGIHGSPDPTAIGKHQSHGCVRLTNWDAAELGRAVAKGVKVEFVGVEAAPARKTG